MRKKTANEKHISDFLLLIDGSGNFNIIIIGMY